MSCPDCFKGSVHNHGTPTGRFEHLYGYRTYVAEGSSNAATPATKSTIVYLPDAFSVALINNRVLADRYARDTGCRVLLPDIIPNGGLNVAAMAHVEDILKPAGWSILAWLNRARLAVTILFYAVPFMLTARAPRCYPSVVKYTRAVKADLPPGAKLGVCGFCWGGYGATRMCAETSVEGGNEKLIDASFTAHPSFLPNADAFVEPLSKFKTPYSCAVAEKDMMFSAKKAEDTEAALRAKIGPASENNYEFVHHKGATHGFAVRANPDVKVEKQASEDAANQAVRWFRRFLL